MKLLLFVLIFNVVLAETEKKCEYNIIAPKAVKLGTEFYFNVDYQCEENSTFALTASIVAWTRWSQDKSVITIATKQFVINSGDYKRLALEVPKVKHGRSTINFTVEATGSETFNRSGPIQSNEKYLSLFIQTDKHFYKPGQMVHYRVLAFDGYLKPYKKPFNITIHDTRGNLVVQRLLEMSELGVLKGELQLSPATALGRWRLAAKCEDAIKTVFFEVSEYVLPKYKVEIQTPKYYLINTVSSDNNDMDYFTDESKEKSSEATKQKFEDLKFSISAKYTFGKPVKGVANVFFTLTGHYNRRSSTVPSYTKIVELEAGKADVSITFNELLTLIPCRSDSDNLDYRSVNIKVNVIERETSKQLTASKTVQVKVGKYKLEYLGQNSYFKAGFKTREYIQLKHINEKKNFLEDIKHPNGTMKSLAIRIRYKTANYSSSTQERKLISLNKYGIGILELNVHDLVEKINIEAAFYDSVADQSTYAPNKELTAIKTRDKKLLDLQLKREKGFFKPNKGMVFTVNTTEAISTFYYQIFGKNVLVVSEKMDGLELSKTHEFTVNITEKLAIELAPSAQILAFYINSGGEVVADGMKIVVDDYFANKVELTFNETTALPSSKVALNIHAPNQSYVGYFAIDQSVLLMGSYDMFSQKMVENDLDGYSIKHFVNWGRKKRSLTREPTDEDEEDEDNDDRLKWPFHTLAKSTEDLINNAGVLMFTSHYIHKHVVYYDYAYNDYSDMSDSVPMAMHASSSFKSTSRMKSVGATSSSDSPTPVRKNFPETWFWVDLVKSDSEDQQELLTVPDTITEWVVSAFSTHAEKGVGVSKPAHLTVFQPLFVSLNLPASIIRGEELALTITVFNYQPVTANVTVTLKKSEKYKVKKCTSENINVLIGEDTVRTMEIKADDAASFHVWFVATSVGQVPIEVEAVSLDASDAVQRKLLVKPEGEQQWRTKSSFIKPTSSSPSNTSFTIEIPPSEIYVPDSSIFQLTTIGDILGPVTANIGRIISVPRGCGEQNIVNLAPNVYSLTYLNAANISNPTLTHKLMSHIESGYQQQLTFHRYDNSYSAFGEDDVAGSTWLTAFVMKSFREAQEHTFIPNLHLQESLKWLCKRQTNNGTFIESPHSRIIHEGMQGGSGEALTPYVLISLLKNKVPATENQKQTEEDRSWLTEAINKATENIESNLDEYQDAYTLSIVAYALHLARSPQLETVQTKLDALATQKDGKMYWKQAPRNDTNKEDDLIWKAFGEQPPTHEIEMTAYNLLIRAEQGSIEKSLPIAQWLIENSNGRGGFVSTQDTVLAIEALSKFASLILETNNPDVNINVTYVGQNSSETVRLEKITKVNSLVLQTLDIPIDTKTVKVEAEGEGFALIQFVSRFNTFNDLENNDLNLEIDSQIIEDQLNLSISTNYTGEKHSGMVLVEVKVLTGYTLHDVDMLRLNLRGIVKKVEVGADTVNFYLDELRERVSFSMLFDKNLPVHGIKPASVQIYKYYQPSTRAIKYYTGRSGSVWVSACPKCCE